MIDQEYILLIMNCKKYEKKALFQKMTWLKLIPSYLKYYHVIGDTAMETEYEFDNSLPKKVIASYIAVNNTFNYKYIFKTDDDQILVNNQYFDLLCNLIKVKEPKTHYGGFIVDVKQPYMSEYHRIHPELPKQLPLYITKYCSGRFYFLSSEAVQYLILKRANIEREFLEDYAIGFNLSRTLKESILLISTNKYFTDIELSDFPKLVEEGKI